jgi:hypothetical protein
MGGMYVLIPSCGIKITLRTAYDQKIPTLVPWVTMEGRYFSHGHSRIDIQRLNTYRALTTSVLTRQLGDDRYNESKGIRGLFGMIESARVALLKNALSDITRFYHLHRIDLRLFRRAFPNIVYKQRIQIIDPICSVIDDMIFTIPSDPS